MWKDIARHVLEPCHDGPLTGGSFSDMYKTLLGGLLSGSSAHLSESFGPAAKLCRYVCPVLERLVHRLTHRKMWLGFQVDILISTEQQLLIYLFIFNVLGQHPDCRLAHICQRAPYAGVRPAKNKTVPAVAEPVLLPARP